MQDIKSINENIKEKSLFITALKQEINHSIIGQEKMINRLLVALLGKGHILLEGVPGLAKTLSITSLAKTLAGSFNRIQFTPDLLPSDVVGTLIYNTKENDFSVKKGPIFANFVLADEINRAPAKVQSALLEAMQEKQVTIGENTFKLEQPFLVLATQNPLDQEGTYPLPEAQMDRFILKTVIDYPSMEEEHMIVKNFLKPDDKTSINQVISLEEILEGQKFVHSVYMDEKIEKYILNIIFATRYQKKYKLNDLEPIIKCGASPRGTLSLALTAKCFAFINRRGYVIPEDVREMAYDVLRHRITLTYEAEAENITTEEVIRQIIDEIEVP